MKKSFWQKAVAILTTFALLLSISGIEMIPNNVDFVLTASALTYADYEYTVSGSNATITKYNGNETNLIIPPKFGEYNVTEIGAWCFNSSTNGKNIVSINIPDTVVNIGAKAFSGSSSLVSVKLPKTVSFIGDHAFSYCTSLETIELPTKISGLDGTFQGCTKLKSIDIPGNVKYIGWDTFSGCSLLSKVTIAEGVESIGVCAFANCVSLTKIDIPKSVTAIADDAFSGAGISDDLSEPIANLSDYPPFPNVTQKYFVIYDEGFRNSRREVCFFDVKDNSEQHIVWNGSLNLSDSSLYINDSKWLLDSNANSWVQFETGYPRMSDWATNVYASNLNVCDKNGNVIIPALPIDTGNEIIKEGNFNGHTYAVYNEGKTWKEAKAYCENLGGHLATITSQEEQSFVESLIKDTEKNYYWLGGTDEVTEGVWKWITEENWSYTSNTFRPDNHATINGAEEHYLSINRADFSWNDLQNEADPYGKCSKENGGFICEWGVEDEATNENKFPFEWSSESSSYIYNGEPFKSGNRYSVNGDLQLDSTIASALGLEKSPIIEVDGNVNVVARFDPMLNQNLQFYNLVFKVAGNFKSSTSGKVTFSGGEISVSGIVDIDKNFNATNGHIFNLIGREQEIKINQNAHLDTLKLGILSEKNFSNEFNVEKVEMDKVINVDVSKVNMKNVFNVAPKDTNAWNLNKADRDKISERINAAIFWIKQTEFSGTDLEYLFGEKYSFPMTLGKINSEIQLTEQTSQKLLTYNVKIDFTGAALPGGMYGYGTVVYSDNDRKGSCEFVIASNPDELVDEMNGILQNKIKDAKADYQKASVDLILEAFHKFLPNSGFLKGAITVSNAHDAKDIIATAIRFKQGKNGIFPFLSESVIPLFQITANCPVNINMYDNNGVLVAQIKDNVVEYTINDSVKIELKGEAKEILVLNSNNKEYRVEFIGNGNGELSYTALYKDKLGVETKRVNFYNIPIYKGKTFVGNISENFIENPQFALTQKDDNSNTVILPDEVFANGFAPLIMINSNEPIGGSVYGYGYYCKGDTVLLGAESNDNNVFLGWYENGVKISDSEEFSFGAQSDRSIEAKFEIGDTLPSGKILGDINNDSIVDNRDVIKLKRYLAGWPEEAGMDTDVADVDRNGVVDERDYLIMRRAVVGWEEWVGYIGIPVV